MTNRLKRAETRDASTLRVPSLESTTRHPEDVGRRRFTSLQGQYLAFIHAYTLVNGRPPAQADLQRFFRVTPPSVHQMLLTLERGGLISRRPGVPRTIAVLVDRSALPALEPGYGQPVNTSVPRY